MDMESLREVAVARVLLLLYKKKKLYTTELAKQDEYSISWRHLHRILPSMVQEGLVKTELVRNKKYYSLTEKGEALAWALLNPDALADLYRKEETVRGIGIETLRDFFNKTKALTTKEMSLFRAYFLGEVSDGER
jgi:DNA-binding PadR family transcriptional regulator